MELRTGRSPSGNVRNFAAMGPAKFAQVAAAVRRENNDPVALAKLAQVEFARRYIAQQQRDWGAPPESKPANVDQDIWDTLLALAS